MYLSVFFFIVNAIFINPSECYHHYRSKLHRRQMPQTPQQIPQPYNSLKQPNSQFPVAYPVYPPSFAMNRPPDRNFDVSYGNPFEPPEPYFGNEAMRNGNVPVPNNNVRSLPANNEIPSHNVTAPPANISISLVKNTELLIQSSPLKNAEVKTKADNVSPFPKLGIFPEFSSTFMGDAQPAFSNYGVPIENYRKSVLSAPSYLKPSGIDGSRRRITGSKRRKKNIGEYDDSLMKVFERGKKLLKLSTASNLTTENGVITDVTTDNYSSETDTIDYSTTLVPLPKGIQVKSVQKFADSLVHATVNISSSTQKIVTYDNNTEVENVIEMDMERKIEDGKGADKGYEEIQIIEKERVKPIIISKISKVRRGKRKNQKNNFFDKRNKSLELSTLSDLTTVTDLTADNDFTVDYYVTTDNDLTSNNYDTTTDNHSDQTDEIVETGKVKPLYTSETSKFYRRKKKHKNNFGGEQKKQLEVPTENDLTTLIDVTTDNDVTTNNDFTADDDFATDNDFTTDNYDTIDDHSDEIDATTETEKVRPMLKLERSELPNKRMESKNNNFYEKKTLFELSTRSDFAKIADITTDNDVNTDSEFITDKDLITDDNLTPHNYSDETKPLVETESVKPMFTLKTSKFHNTRKKRKNNIFEKQKKLLVLSTLNDLATTDNNTTGSYLKIDNGVITDNDFVTENDLIIDNDYTIDNNFAGTGVIRETKKIEPMFKSETSKFHSRRSQMEKNKFFEGKNKLLELSTKSDLDTVIDNTIDNNFITDNDVRFDHDLSADNDLITDNDVIRDNVSEEPGAIVETESSKPMVESELSEFNRKKRKKYKNDFFQKEKKQLKISTVNYLTNNDVISDNYSEEPGAIAEKESAKPMAESKLSKLHRRRSKNYKNIFFHKEKKRLKISTVNYPTNNYVTSDNYFEEPGAIVEMESAKPMAESKVSEFHGRRNKSYKNTFYQKEKKQIKISTVNYPIINDAQTNDNSVETDPINYSTSLLHLPEGIQLKAVTKYDNSIIHAAVNISSSTQMIVTYDNNTELDNFIKMNMVERIEDEKGANKGFENVQIVEKKKVKPVVMSKIDRRRRKYHKNRFFTHHRSKRSILSSDEVPRSNSLYNKMAKRFLLALKRKERVVEPDDIMNRGIIPDFQEMNQKTSTANKKQKIGHLIYDKKEMGNLIKLLLNEMKKIQISRENKKNINTPHRRTCNGCTGFKILPHKMKKLKITSPDPKPMNFIMNIWDSKMKDRVAKSIEVLKEYKTVKYENTSSTESTSELNSMTPKYVEEKQSAEMLTAVLFFSVMSCFVAVLSLVLSKSCKRLKVNRMKSAMKNYPLYDAYPKNRAKEIESKNLLPQENQELEWQSENGNWLSEI